MAQGPVPERSTNSILGINVPYSGTFNPGIELLHLSGTGSGLLILFTIKITRVVNLPLEILNAGSKKLIM